jgi:hypothetical protein
MAVGGLAYAAGNSAAKSSAREQDQNEQIAYLQAQAAQQQAAQAQQMQPPPQQMQPPPQQTPPQPAAPAAPPMDPKIAQLQELAQLKSSGILTEEEFAAQKARILGS